VQEDRRRYDNHAWHQAGNKGFAVLAWFTPRNAAARVRFYPSTARQRFSFEGSNL